MIKKGKAYVCDLTAEQIREYRGTLDRTGKRTVHTEISSVEENLQIYLNDMKNGEFADGAKGTACED